MCSSYQFGTEFMIVEISKRSRQADYQYRTAGLVNKVSLGYNSCKFCCTWLKVLCKSLNMVFGTCMHSIFLIYVIFILCLAKI